MSSRFRPGWTCSGDDPTGVGRGAKIFSSERAGGDSDTPSFFIVPMIGAVSIARAEPPHARLLSEILADAAISGSISADVLRHRAVAGASREIGRRVPADALRRAALKAVDRRRTFGAATDAFTSSRS